VTEKRARNAMLVAARMLAVAAVIGLSSWLAIDLTRPEGGVTVIWIASGLLVGMLLTAAHRYWPAYIVAALVGEVVARVAYGDPIIEAVVHGSASTFEACVVAYALRYWVGDVSDPVKLPSVSRIAPLSTLVACAMSALMVAVLVSVRGTGPFGPTFASWFTSHLLGIVIVATTFVVIRFRGLLLLTRPTLRWNLALTMCLLAATTLLVFSQSRYPLLFLIYPVLVLAVFRHRVDGAVSGIVVVVVVSLVATLQGLGPLYLITDSSMQERLELLQFFFAMACLTTLPVVVVLAQRSRLERALAFSEQRLRAITDNLPALVSYIDTQQRYTFANGARGRTPGLDAESIVGRTLREVFGEQTYAGMRPHVEAALRGERVTFDREANADGRHFQYQTDFIPDCARDGSVRGFYAMTFDISERVLVQQELQRIAHHDSLTGLANRNLFNDHLERALARFRRSGHPLALVYLDIDCFKHINDTNGHAVGDAVLCEFATRLQANLRGTDLALRLGGDEFAVIIEDIESLDRLHAVARRLIGVMQPDIIVDGAKTQITASIGIAVCDTSATVESLMLGADRALYEAKAAGRNTYRLAGAEKERRKGVRRAAH
jgi:diguanylate cyclase (GGDEF)-like protein/PAS domain S-box-containing protein